MTHLDVERSKMKISWPFTAETENASYIPKGRPTNFKTCAAMEYDETLKSQGNKVISSLVCMFVHNSTMRSYRNTHIGRKVVRASGDIALQLKYQLVAGQGH